MKLFSILISSAAVLISWIFCSKTEAAPTHHGDVHIGYYRMEDYLPAQFSTCYFILRGQPASSWGKIHVYRGFYRENAFWIEGGSCFPFLKVAKWRYDEESPHSQTFTKPPSFDEYLIYHSVQHNPPTSGQFCYFIERRWVKRSIGEYHELLGKYEDNPPYRKGFHEYKTDGGHSQFYEAGTVELWREVE